MTDVVNSPAHYTQSRFSCECIEITRHMTFLAGNAQKYIWRHAEKNGVEDLRKAAVYLRWAIEEGEPAALYGHSDDVFYLVRDHVALPLYRQPDAAPVYDALVKIGQFSDFEGALDLVESAIRDYEEAAA